MDNKEIYNDIIRFLDTISYVKPEKVPYIDIYMDQVTGFMEQHLKSVKRHEDDKVLTKTMINNYTKARLLPPPKKKKYNREHIFMLLFIYYYKGLLSLDDLRVLLEDIKTKYFGDKNLSVEDIYKEVFSLEASQMEVLKQDIRQKFELAEKTFEKYESRGKARGEASSDEAASSVSASKKDSDPRTSGVNGTDFMASGGKTADQQTAASADPDVEMLRLFSFACELGFDIYLKQLMLENICDRLREHEGHR